MNKASKEFYDFARGDMLGGPLGYNFDNFDKEIGDEIISAVWLKSGDLPRWCGNNEARWCHAWAEIYALASEWLHEEPRL